MELLTLPGYTEGRRGDTSTDFIEQVVCSYDFFVPHESAVPQEIHMGRGKKVYSWLLRNNIVSPGELREIRERKGGLNEAEFRVIEATPQDYWLIATARGMNKDQQSRFEDLLAGGKFDLKHYLLQQSVWAFTAFSNYRQTNGRFPSREEETRLVDGMSGEFRVYWVLKRDVFGENVDYPGAIDSWHIWMDQKRKRDSEENEKQGMVTAWQM